MINTDTNTSPVYQSPNYPLPARPLISLRYCDYAIYPADRLVRTTFPSGHYCDGTRDEGDPNNLREAHSQGYTGPFAVWRSLVEHELLHSVVAEVVFDTPSRVMVTESGAGYSPSWERYEEETMCLALQVLLNTPGKSLSVLNSYNIYTKRKVLSIPPLWQERYAPVLAPLWEGGEP